MEREFHQPKQLVLSWAPHLVPSFNYHHIVLKPFQVFGGQRDRNHLGRRTTKSKTKTHTRENKGLIYTSIQHLLKACYVPCTVLGAEHIKIEPILYPQEKPQSGFREHMKAKYKMVRVLWWQTSYRWDFGDTEKVVRHVSHCGCQVHPSLSKAKWPICKPLMKDRSFWKKMASD